MDGASGAVLDHEEAEAEREAAEKDRLAAEQAGAGDPGGPNPDPDPDPEHEEDQGPSISIPGSQLSLAVGGKRPTSATVRLTGGKVQIPAGQLEKGKAITVLVTAIVDDVGFKDLRDPKTKQIVGCERRHKAFVTGTELLEQE